MIKPSRKTYIVKSVEYLLTKHNVTTTPIDVEKIIESEGIRIRHTKTSHDVFGAAIIKDGVRLITVKEMDCPQRQRFTLAHELGHMMLHAEQAINIDHKEIKFLRDIDSSRGTEWREVEANFFAASSGETGDRASLVPDVSSTP